MSAEDDAGVDYAYVQWANPAALQGGIKCYFSGSTCTAVVDIADDEAFWGFAGLYYWNGIEIWDKHNVYRNYKTNGTYQDQITYAGSHNLVVPNLTVE